MERKNGKRIRRKKWRWWMRKKRDKKRKWRKRKRERSRMNWKFINKSHEKIGKDGATVFRNRVQC